MQRLFTHWVPLIAWAGLIIVLSSIPSLESGMPLSWDVLGRKIAHAVEYALLGFFGIRALRKKTPSTFILIGVFCVAFAVSDEIHQSFVPGREGTPWDVLIDSLGASVGLLVTWRLQKQRVRRGMYAIRHF